MKDLLKINKAKLIIIGIIAIALIFSVWIIILAGIIIAEIILKFLHFSSTSKAKKIEYQDDLVSVTIVNWNSKDYIMDCLKSISFQKYPHIELIVVDNNSSDGSLEQLKKYIEKNKIATKIIENNKNFGFSKAHNQAIKIAKGEYILTLNFDVYLSEHFIANMVRELELENKIGISSGKIFNKTQTADGAILDTTGVELINLFCSDRGQGDIDRGQYNSQEYVFGASGCASFYRREMLEDIKFNGEYFDETFNTYVEDVDLSWRAQAKGWKCLYNPNAVAFHDRGATRKGDNKESKIIYRNYFIQGFRNRYLMILKNLALSTFIRKFRYIIWGECRFWVSVFLTDRYFYAKFIVGFIMLCPLILIKRVYAIGTGQCKGKASESLLRWIG